MLCPNCGARMFELDGYEEMDMVCLNCYTRKKSSGYSINVISNKPLTRDEYRIINDARKELEKKAKILRISHGMQWKILNVV